MELSQSASMGKVSAQLLGMKLQAWKRMEKVQTSKSKVILGEANPATLPYMQYSSVNNSHSP